MKLLLINPSKYDEKGRLMKFKFGTFPPLNLLLLSGLIEKYKNVKIKIIDEFIEEIPFNEHFDLIGITTSFTSNFPRVIDISKEFRKRNIPVVLGGTHVTCTSNESIKYADCIVVGEGEHTFPQLIDDFLRKKKLKKIYKNKDFINLEKEFTLPKYDLIDSNKYFKIGFVKKTNMFQIESSRGCPMKCNFCAVRKTHGPRIRYKSIDNVIKEIRFLKKMYNANFFSFTDDNFLYHYGRSKMLLQELSKENIKFFCEVSTTIINKPELIPLLKKAGCTTALIGFESINTNTIHSIGKTHNKVERYANLISLFNNNNISILASLILGFDEDDINIFSSVLNFLKRNNIPRVLLNILVPFPGTELYNKFSNSNRIINNNLSLYDACHVVFQPKNLAINQLENKFWELYKKFYSIKEIFGRLTKLSITDWVYLLSANLRFRKLVYNNLYPFNSGIKRIKYS